MARYNDGRSAITQTIALDIGEAGLGMVGETIAWRDLMRADDGGEIVLKRTTDTGERFRFDDAELESVRRFAPRLLSKTALPREGVRLLGGLVAVAGSLAALFLFVLPLEAEPVSRIMPARYREHLADLGWRQVEAFSDTCSADSDGWGELEGVFDNLRARMRESSPARLDIVDARMPNAFTLPDDSIVLTTGMIAFAKRPDEIAGVLAHELGHVEARHVLPGLVRQMGVGLFIDVVFGGAGAGQIAAAVNILSLRFSRADEAEADQIGYRLMEEAGYDPGAMADLFSRFGDTEKRGFVAGDLLSSHPDSGKRAAEAKLHARPDRPPALDDEAWQAVRDVCNGGED